ncbi:MAG: hypothetical protein WBA07_17985 [Rivularia sp. (in: cyanobacteria)]
MNIRWQKLLVKTSFWLATEIILNLVGIDDLADYSEFIYENPNFTAKIGCISTMAPMV